MFDITIILLTFNEEKNLPECLASIKDVKANKFAVDSYSSDNTLNILSNAGVQCLQHPFENYSRQRNWSQNNVPFNTPWIFHLDAGERFTPELVRWVNNFNPNKTVDGYMFSRRTIIFGKEVKYGGQYPNFHLRLYKRDKGKCEDKMYDQHFVVNGAVEIVKNRVDIIDTVMDSWQAFTLGHSRWAVFEAVETLKREKNKGEVRASIFGSPIERRRWLKNNVFQKSPLFARALLFFIYRYFFKFGFLDGKTGLAFHFLQGCWFRFLIDATILELKTKMSTTELSLHEVVEQDYGSKLDSLFEDTIPKQ